jgi:DNA-binding HxlR family transcriptional regulator
MARSYNQHCGLAHALDLIGERWTLLIVRELMAGPMRYTDLAEGLVSVPSNVLAVRLREMESAGLIARRHMPAPAASTVYELTPRGSGLEAAVTELARWGMRTLPAPGGSDAFRGHWLVLALKARFDPAALAKSTRESYELQIPGEATVSFTVRGRAGEARLGPAIDPSVRIVADAPTMLALTEGAIEPSEALAQGARIEGEPAALARLRSAFPTLSQQAADAA